MIVARFQKNPIDTSVVAQMMNFKKPQEEDIASKIKRVIKMETGTDLTQYRHYRGEDLVTARFIFMIMMLKYTKEPYRVIAGMVGRNHATINHAIKEVNNRCDTDKNYKKVFDRIDSQIKSKLQ